MEDDYNEDQLSPKNFWKCHECGETVENTFDVCWNCQKLKPGVVEYQDDDDEELNSNAENYWKCPECGETVEIDFDVCWNCQEPKPEKVEQPDMDEIIQYQSDEEITLNAENFWKCPKCGETIESNFDACWNCLNPRSDEGEKPSVKEILSYQSNKEPAGLVKSGFLIIGAGIVLLTFSGLTPLSDAIGYERTYYGRLLFGVFFIIAGVFLLILGSIRKD